MSERGKNDRKLPLHPQDAWTPQEMHPCFWSQLNRSRCGWDVLPRLIWCQLRSQQLPTLQVTARGVGWLLSSLPALAPAATESSEFTPSSLQLLHRAGFWDEHFSHRCSTGSCGCSLSGVTTSPSMVQRVYLECCPAQLQSEALTK